MEYSEKYMVKHDPNGYVINEGIRQIKRVDVDVSALLNDYVVALPDNAFGLLFLNVPVNTEAKVNDSDYIPVDTNQTYSPWVEGIDSLLIKTTSVDATNKLTIAFLL